MGTRTSDASRIWKSNTENRLVFVHLSDIHFNKKGLDHYEVDRDLRDQLELDIGERMRPEFAEIRGVLISGDIAFGGEIEEYDAARTWLKALCQRAGIHEQNVWSVPGNHDIVRKHFEDSAILRDLHHNLRPADPEKVDEMVALYLRDKHAAELLFQPLSNYNDHFAKHFRCPSSIAPLSWQHDLELNDGSTLRLYGINSAMVSDKTDSIFARKLVVGSVQARPKEEIGVSYLAMCHHPPDWLIDQDNVHRSLVNRARIQLFGHKHILRAERIENSVKIGAGAVHPSRSEKFWIPRYNLIAVSVRTSTEGRLLDVDVYPRVWNDNQTRFFPDQPECDTNMHFRRFTLELGPWTPPLAVSHAPVTSAALTWRGATPPIVTTDGAVTLAEPNDREAARALTYRFLDLPHVTRLRIAQELDLYTNDDEGLRDTDLFERIFIRALRAFKLADLWQRVEAQHGNNAPASNPFHGR